MNLDDGSLYPEQNGEFMALLDFDVSELHYPEMRRVQLEAVKQSGVGYRKPKGDIRARKFERFTGSQEHF